MGVKLSEWKLKITENVERVMSKVTGAADKASGKFTALQDKVNKTSDAFKNAASEVPYLNRAIELTTNPYVALAGSVLAVGAAMGVAHKKAAAFNHQFLELKNLNLDKTSGQLKKLNDDILNLSIAEGLDPVKTAQAFFDVQSATGKYGAEVEEIVRKVGRFSIATKTDLPAAINGSVKAMKAFGFGAEQMDNYLQSSAKTVQIGIVTFDQLAQVQTEFGGAAAAAGQNFDTANKVFAAFTTIAKDANIAANMTKTAFQGLTMKSTVDGFNKIGVSLFDASGKMLAMDQVVEQLVPKLKKMSDQDFLKLRNEVGGPEGLQSLLNQLRASGDDVLGMFNMFDNTKFNLDEALKNAKGDFTTLSEIVGNRYSAVMTKLGQIILPTVAKVLDKVNTALLWAGENFDTVKKVVGAMASVVGVASIAWAAYKVQMLVAKAVTLGMIGITRALSTAITAIPIIGWVAGAVSAVIVLYQTFDGFRAMVDGVFNVFVAMMPLFTSFARLMVDLVTNPIKAIQSAKTLVSEFKKLDLSTAYNEGYDRSMASSKASRETENAFGDDPITKLNETKEEDNKVIEQGLNDVSEGGKSTRSVVVNIENLVKGLSIHAATVKEGAEDIRRIVLEELVRAVNGSEQALSS